MSSYIINGTCISGVCKSAEQISKFQIPLLIIVGIGLLCICIGLISKPNDKTKPDEEGKQ